MACSCGSLNSAWSRQLLLLLPQFVCRCNHSHKLSKQAAVASLVPGMYVCAVVHCCAYGQCLPHSSGQHTHTGSRAAAAKGCSHTVLWPHIAVAAQVCSRTCAGYSSEQSCRAHVLSWTTLAAAWLAHCGGLCVWVLDSTQSCSWQRAVAAQCPHCAAVFKL